MDYLKNEDVIKALFEYIDNQGYAVDDGCQAWIKRQDWSHIDIQAIKNQLDGYPMSNDRAWLEDDYADVKCEVADEEYVSVNDIEYEIGMEDKLSRMWRNAWKW